MVKVNTFLEDAIDGKLGKREMNELRKELILIEVDKKNQQLQDEIKVFNFLKYLLKSTSTFIIMLSYYVHMSSETSLLLKCMTLFQTEMGKKD